MKSNLTILMFIVDLSIVKRSFQDGAIPGKTVFFGTSLQNPCTTILQINIKAHCTKVNILNYLSFQFEALVILLQETYWNNAEKLVLTGFQLAGSS